VRKTVIRVEDLGKKYLLEHNRENRPRYAALRDVLANGLHSLSRKLARPFRRVESDDDKQREFWALRDVSFEIAEGDVAGIIGRNGAGKSTLLKILSRITGPTLGRVGMSGRVASLLEVGTGFHPELSGRENIFLNGAILGMTWAEIKKKFDAIVVFAEIERFLDTPVKRYSSGMYVRLAFAVAAHLEPEILIVDEVLAVGDTAFQKKCLGKMGEVATSGRTVLFVSHNMAAVANLCSRAIVLERGRVALDGTVQDAIALYNQDGNTHVYVGEARPHAPCIRRVEIDLEALSAGDLRVAVQFESPFPLDPLVGVVVHSQQGAPLLGSNQLVHGEGYRGAVLRLGVATLTIRDLPLYSGYYKVSIWLCDRHNTRVYDRKIDALGFDLVSRHTLPPGISSEVNGPVRTTASWELTPGTVDTEALSVSASRNGSTNTFPVWKHS
jgi:lipopolysaccharide transport system ATP-binding protein